MGVNSLPKTVTRQRRGCDLNPGPSAPESDTLTTRLPSHPSCQSASMHTQLSKLLGLYDYNCMRIRLYHGLRGSASPVLTATGFVNGRWQFSTPTE